MSRNLKVSAALVAIVAVVIAVIALASGGGDDDATRAAATTTGATPAPTETTPGKPAPAPTTTGATPAPRTTPKGGASPQGESERDAATVVAADPRTLGRPGDGKVTFTEFLDFECPACGAAYPLVEQLRQEYAGRVTFNIRYFPLPSHRNAMPAALAAEAAAQQGKLAPMYAKLFQTQRQWGGQQRSQAGLFRAFADELDLDVAQYDADVRSRRTRKRVQRDLDAAQALELPGTPSFFINEQPVEPRSADHLRSLLDTALSGKPLPTPERPDPNDPGHSHDAVPMTEA